MNNRKKVGDRKETSLLIDLGEQQPSITAAIEQSEKKLET